LVFYLTNVKTDLRQGEKLVRQQFLRKHIEKLVVEIDYVSIYWRRGNIVEVLNMPPTGIELKYALLVELD